MIHASWSLSIGESAKDKELNASKKGNARMLAKVLQDVTVSQWAFLQVQVV